MRRTTALLTALDVAVSACGGSDSSAPSASTETTASDTPESTEAVSTEAVADTTDESESTTAAASSTANCDDATASFAVGPSVNPDLADPEVDATCDGESIVVTSNGIPDYVYIETSPGSPDAVDLTFTLPLDPTYTDETTAVALLGSIAVATTGLPIYGPTEGTGGDVLSLEGALSECGSHNGPTGFHIHLLGTAEGVDCLFTPAEVASGPQLLGYAFDGYPIYTGNDQYTSSWELADESLFATDTWAAHEYVAGSGDLDECNGLTDDAGAYAYYTTDTFPYVLGCYHGVVDLDTVGGDGGGGADGPDDGQGPPP